MLATISHDVSHQLPSGISGVFPGKNFSFDNVKIRGCVLFIFGERVTGKQA